MIETTADRRILAICFVCLYLMSKQMTIKHSDSVLLGVGHVSLLWKQHICSHVG